jgi:hypothetical protein
VLLLFVVLAACGGGAQPGADTGGAPDAGGLADVGARDAAPPDVATADLAGGSDGVPPGDGGPADIADGGALDGLPDGTPDAGATGPDVPAEPPGTCFLTPEERDPDFTGRIGCRADYEAVAAPPLVASIPGALSAKTVVDRIDGNRLYVQNSRRYPIHWNFASTHLSGNGLPLVPPLSQFNATEYYTPDRRFLLGALNYYEGPRVWAYEIAPYDSASADLIAAAFAIVRDALWVGDRLTFHPTSDNVAREAAKLPAEVPIVTTEQLFAGISYQPLNLATGVGQLRFFSKGDLETSYLSYRDIAVLEAIPNDLSACVGTITDQFQTPLSHINVLAQNRGTPNMALRGAFHDPRLRALEGRWVELVVGASNWSIREVTPAAADAWWEAHRPAAVAVPRVDLSVTDLRDIEDVLDVAGLGLAGALAQAIPAFGGKASHYGAFPHITSSALPYPRAFVVPIHYYDQFMRQNGFYQRVEALLAEPAFQDDPRVREDRLRRLRADMRRAPIDPEFFALLTAKLAAEYPGVRMRFRSSTNCEDLDGFTGAGLYESATGDPNDPSDPYDDAVRRVWSSVWRFRAFEEREYRGISHREVGMALLVHRGFPEEDANGVAITANLFDTYGAEPGYYVNVQRGDVSVVLPPTNVTSDQFLYHYDLPGQPLVFLGHSNLVPEGQTVLTRAQVATLAEALAAIHAFFEPLYGPLTPEHFYAMDVEFKFDTEPGSGESLLVIKQARPYPGRGE